MIIARIKIALFAVVTLCPLLGLFAISAVKSYQDAPPKFPSLTAVLVAQRGSLDSLGEALLARSAITRAAIRLKNEISYEFLGFVDTKDVVSGSNGWLFYKGDLRRKCLSEQQVRRSLAQLDLVIGIATAAGIEMIISVSPDKSSIYPERLGSLARGYMGCRASDTSLLRRLIKSDAPAVLDHSEPLLAEKNRHPDIKLYFETDTHWTRYGAALALRQLLEAVFPSAPQTAPPKIIGTVEGWTDMRNRLLLLDEFESFDALDEGIETSLVDPGAPQKKTTILRDSFYGIFPNHLRASFPSVQILLLGTETDAYYDAIASADRLIVNSVERELIDRVDNGGLSWWGKLNAAILQRNELKARACEGFTPAAVESSAQRNVMKTESGWTASGLDPQIPVTLPPSGARANLCLRLTFESSKAGIPLEVFLPSKRGDRRFEAGRSIPILTAGGEQTFTMVLPSDVAGGFLRIDPGPGLDRSIVLKSIELGALSEEKRF